jgi:S-methylmethionine-dependent homocysteine/selenocysteine methylase
MQILSTEEIEKNGAEKKTFGLYEFLSLGIAVQAKDIYSTKSKLLGGTFGDYFESYDFAIVHHCRWGEITSYLLVQH